MSLVLPIMAGFPLEEKIRLYRQRSARQAAVVQPQAFGIEGRSDLGFLIPALTQFN